MRIHAAPFGALGCSIALASCTSYTAAPLDPARTESGFAARTLEDEAFVAWARGALPPQETFPPETWDVASLSLAAFWFHPDVAVARAQVSTAKAGVVTASTRPNPTFSFRPEYVTNPAPGESAWVADLGLDFPIETGGKRDLREEKAKKRALAAEVGVYEAAWRVRGKVRAAWYDHGFGRLEVEALREEAQQRRDAVAVLRRKLEAGEAARFEVSRAEIELSKIEVESCIADSRVAESRVALASAIGVTAVALDRVRLDEADLERLPTDAPDATHTAGFLDRFDVRRALLEYDAAEADVRLEVAKQMPDLSLAPGYVYDQGLRKLAFSFALPLPLFDRNQGPIAEAEARRSEAQAKFMALQATATGEIEGALARYKGAATELAEVRRLRERQRESSRAVERALEVGRADSSDVALAHAEVSALRRGEIAALRRAQAALGDLEDALQRPLAGALRVPESLLGERSGE